MSIETENSAYGERSAASTMISQEERQAWRENHRPAKAGSIKGACVFCGASPWPCPIIRLLDALDAAERPAPLAASAEELRTIGDKAEHDYAPPAENAGFEAAWKPWIEGREQVRYRPSMRDAGRAMWDAALEASEEREGRLLAAFDAWSLAPTWGGELFEAFAVEIDALRAALTPEPRGER